MTWYAHRRQDGTIASLHREMQPEYATEALADDNPDVATFFSSNSAPDLSNPDNHSRAVRAILQVIGDWDVLHTPAQAKAAFKQAWDQLNGS